MTKKVDLSIIVPMYNEEENIDLFFSSVQLVLKKIPELTYEFICINDGSQDKTLDILKTYAKKNKSIKIISFSRNFKKEQALYAGLEHCSGRAAIVMDVDMQDPPELIEEFVQKWQKGFEVVYGVRIDRNADTFFKKMTANFFYKIYNLISETKIPDNVGDFRLLDRKVIDAVLSIKEKKLFMKGIFNWVGFKSIGVPYKRQQRAAGTTKWSYWKLWNFALDGITSSTTLPLRIWTYFGAFVACFSFLYGFFIIIRTLIFGIDIPGYASLLVCILFLGGIQLLALGIFGEYIGRIFAEVKDRPLYIIDEKINFK